MNRLAALLLLVWTASAAEYRIAGTLLNVATGRPIARARVYIVPEGGEAETSMFTGADGRFSFDGVAAGNWLLQADRAGFPHLFYGARPEAPAFYSAVVTGPENDTAHLIFRAWPPCVIRGRVADENDEIVPGAAQLLRESIVDGRKRTTFYSYGQIDDRGEYRFWSLPAGVYYVMVLPRTFAPGGPVHQPQYFRDASDASAADRVELRPGEEAVADFLLHRGPAVPGPNARPRPVTVEVSATVQAPAAHKKAIAGTQLNLASDEGYVASHAASPDTAVSLGQLPPGRYRLTATVPDGLYLKSLTAEGGKVSGRNVDIAGSSPVRLTVVLGADAGHVRGKVYADGKPREAMMVVLVPRDEVADPEAYQTESDGSFDYKNVMPGEYTLCVTADLGIEWADRKKLPAGQALRVEPNGNYSLRLEVALPNGL